MGVGGGEPFQKSFEVAGGGAFADKDVHARGNAVLHLFRRSAFVVVQDAAPGVRLQTGSGESRRMTIHGQSRVAGIPDLAEQIVITGQDSGAVHNFPERDGFFLMEERLEIQRGQFSAGVLEGRAGHTGRQGEMDGQGQPRGRVIHIAQGKLASDIGDLVRIGHHTRGAAGKNGSSELPRSEQRGLDMHMGVHEAGNKIFPSAVEDSPGVYGLCLPAAQHSSDSAAVDDNGGAGNHLTVHDVNHFRVCERETAFPSAQSGVYAPLQIFKSYSRHAKPPGGLSSDSYIPSHESCKDTALPRRAGVTFLPFSGICRLHALHHT